jgi:hypothetical protein
MNNKLILTAHQPTYFPWLGTFHKILLADVFCFFDIAQYQKKAWDNRNKILTPQGEQWLTVPVRSKNHYSKTIGDIEVNNDVPWGKKSFKTLQVVYGNHPYYKIHKEFLENVYLDCSWEKLCDLNIFIYKYILKNLNSDVKIVKASDYNFKGQKSDLVLDMCKKLQADTYIFGGEGKNYADILSFNDNGVHPVFQEYNHPTYPQHRSKHPFTSHLSTLDLMMNNPSSKLKEIIMQGNLENV